MSRCGTHVQRRWACLLAAAFIVLCASVAGADGIADHGSERLGALIAAPQLTPWLMALALVMAVGLGALHGLAPGHGKAIVGAYLVGIRGTAYHAALLGLVVTVTHTAGVFALALVALFASQYVLPERLFPILSLLSGAMILTLGLALFVKRLRGALAQTAHHHHALDEPEHRGETVHEHHHHVHGEEHHAAHAEPDGSAASWGSLIALGVSGGILPCPSALIVLLTAVSLHRVGFGLLLIVAFSLGLAATLSAVGLAFIKAGRFIKRPIRSERLAYDLPTVSALVVTIAGGVICYGALLEAGVDVRQVLLDSGAQAALVPTLPLLGLGLVFGLRHALDADHLAAVSTLVSECKSLLSSCVIGGLWGVGHTISLLVAGIGVILLHVEIGPRLAQGLEFSVGLMLVGLGANGLRRVARDGIARLQVHDHGGRLHFHAPADATHGPRRFGVRPLLVGMVHGLAGSAALMLLVLSTIPSPVVGFAYIGVFGVGSIGGMLLMSLVIGLPARFTATRFAHLNGIVRALAGSFSLGFGVWMLYHIGVVEGLLRL